MKKKLIKNNILKTAAILKKAKTITALTCLIGTMMLTQNPAWAPTATGTMAVSSSVAASCTVNAASMTFAAYAGTAITADSIITANCTNATTYTITIGSAFDAGSVYYLVRTGGASGTASDRLEVTFAKVGGAAMPTDTITGTGNGSDQNAGTIRGTIAANQTGKTAGTFSKDITINIAY